jgi:hypothetical protein
LNARGCLWSLSVIGVAMAVASCGGDLSNEVADSGATKEAGGAPFDASDSADASDANHSVDVGDAPDGYPGCRWPAYLDLTDANADEGPCLAERHLIACTFGGVNSVCVSNDLTGCPDDGLVSNAPATCHDVCEPGEYGVRCGFVPPPPPIMGGPPIMEGPFPPPPASCHFTNIDLDELYVECCPCGS